MSYYYESADCLQPPLSGGLHLLQGNLQMWKSVSAIHVTTSETLEVCSHSLGLNYVS